MRTVFTPPPVLRMCYPVGHIKLWHKVELELCYPLGNDFNRNELCYAWVTKMLIN